VTITKKKRAALKDITFSVTFTVTGKERQMLDKEGHSRARDQRDLAHWAEAVLRAELDTSMADHQDADDDGEGYA
jgi:hypothetical protein